MPGPQALWSTAEPIAGPGLFMVGQILPCAGMSRSPLMDSLQLTRHLEEAYQARIIQSGSGCAQLFGGPAAGGRIKSAARCLRSSGRGDIVHRGQQQ